MAELHDNVRLLVELVNELDNSVRATTADTETLDSDLIALTMLTEARKSLANAEKELQDTLGDAMRKRNLTVMGAGTYQRNPRRGATKCTDEKGLWRYVIDTRIVDEDTGEILPTHEVIRRVYGAESKETGEVRVTGASPTKVEALGIDPDDFFEKAPREGWNIRLIA